MEKHQQEAKGGNRAIIHSNGAEACIVVGKRYETWFYHSVCRAFFIGETFYGRRRRWKLETQDEVVNAGNRWSS